MESLPAHSRPNFPPSEARNEAAKRARATAWAGGILRLGRKVVMALGALILLGSASAHNLNQRADYIGFDDATLARMKARQAAGQALIQTGDIVGLIMKATPSVGTPTVVSYKHLRDHATKANLVCRLLHEKKKS